MKDLVALVADKDMEHTMRGLLSRSKALRIHDIQVDIFVHPQHDPACARNGVMFLSRWPAQYRHALLMFDFEGCGLERRHSREEIQKRLDRDFAATDWDDRARTIVLQPELETWIWNDSPHVDEVVGWKGRNPTLRRWLLERNFLNEGQNKPLRPKEAFLAALRETRKPKSANLFLQIAERVTLSRCRDDSFLKLVDLLRQWFPRPTERH